MEDESRKLARRFSTLPVEGAIGLYRRIIGGGVPLFSRDKDVVASYRRPDEGAVGVRTGECDSKEGAIEKSKFPPPTWPPDEFRPLLP